MSAKALYVIAFTVALDAIGVGLILPILPDLLRHLSHHDVIQHYGLIISIYALFQVFFSPILGALSDRLGRRPILLISLAGAAVDYCFMAFAPNITLLYVGRIISGITGANMTVANAYIADITPHDLRAKRYGLLSAAFGIGFIVGPAIGGALGAFSLRDPFLVAAAANAFNFLIALFVLPESHPLEKRRPVNLKKLNPFSSLIWMGKIQGIMPYVTVYSILVFAGLVPQTLWILFCEHRFGWSSQTIGLSLAFFGICMAFSQAVLVSPMIQKFGEKYTLIIALMLDATSYVLMAFIQHGWILMLFVPVFSIASIAQPAMQGIISKTVTESEQGELQGSLTSILSIASIICPLLATSIYAATLHSFSGTVWILTSLLYLLTIPIALSFKRKEYSQTTSTSNQ